LYCRSVTIISPTWVAASNFGENTVFIYQKTDSSQQWVRSQIIQNNMEGFRGFGFALAASFCRSLSTYCLVIGSPFMFETISKQDFEKYGEFGLKSTAITRLGGFVEVWMLNEQEKSICCLIIFIIIFFFYFFFFQLLHGQKFWN
jgi:hypothetical protein